MYRFNGHDHRLQRMLEASCMLMEAFADVSASRLTYEIVGHSGDGPEISFVAEANPPRNEADRLKVLQRMKLHAAHCMSGDYTLEATSIAIDKMAARSDADETFVVVLSDANLDRYGIPPSELGRILR